MALTVKANQQASLQETLRAMGLEVPPVPDKKSKSSRAHTITHSDTRSTTQLEQNSPSITIQDIDLDLIYDDPLQPRRDLGTTELQELAESIKTHGILRPILLHPIPTNDLSQPQKHKIIYGQRAWTAARIAGRQTIPAIVREVDDQTTLELQITENAQRKQLSELEFYDACARLINEFNLSLGQVARRVHRNKSNISRGVRVVQDPEIRASVEAKEISFADAMEVIDQKSKRNHKTQDNESQDESYQDTTSQKQESQLTAKEIITGITKARSQGKKVTSKDIRSGDFTRSNENVADRNTSIAHGIKPKTATAIGKEAQHKLSLLREDLFQSVLHFDGLLALFDEGTPHPKQLNEIRNALDAIDEEIRKLQQRQKAASDKVKESSKLKLIA